MDYLKITLTEIEIKGLSTLALAHIGDGVFELMSRAKVIKDGKTNVNNIHRAVSSMVKATNQALLCEKIMDLLNDDEKDVFRRGKNAKPHIIPKSATRADYAKSTALEALWGYLYLLGRYDRLNEFYHIMFT